MPFELPTEVKAAPQSMRVQAQTFAVGDDVQDGEQLVPVELVALSGEPIDWWAVDAPLYFDLGGLERNKDRIVLDWIHDFNEPIGFIDDFDTSDAKLTCRGNLTPIYEGDRADRVAKQGKAGIPFEASITWEPKTLDYLAEDVELELDGRTITGPAYIARTWTLRAVAVCPLGQDAHTLAKFSADADPASLMTFAVNPQPGDTDVDKTEETTEPTNDDATPETEETNTPEAATEPTSGSTPAGDSEPVDFAAAAKPFIDAFGEERGSILFAKGVSFADAQADELKRLQTENAALKTDDADKPAGGVKFNAQGGGSKPASPFRIKK